MSGLFASLSVGRALEKLSAFLRAFAGPSAASSSSSRGEEDVEELRRLERTLRRIRATLHDAEEHWDIREESAKLRLKELKDLAYDIEDVVEEYEYEVDRRKADAFERSALARNTGKRKHQEENDDCAVDMDVRAVPHELVLQAKKITDRFNEIVHYTDHFSLSENDGERRFTPDISSFRHTSSVVFEKSILGREHDRDIIVEKLFSGEGESVESPISVMAIVGMGGLGKTTLAQLVYNSPRVTQYFDKRAWVCVSEHFDVNTVTRNIITALTGKHCECTELADLQGKLADETRERRVLLVLDDVWNERRDCWELFCMPISEPKICQIIVTTRNEVVARLIQTTPSYHPKCLSSDESWSLFNQAAFINGKEFDISANLINIGKSIVQKCKGLPLAIKALGSMLRFETDERRWKDVLESELWDLKEPRDEVLPALKLSYKHMPVYLRRYFLALSLFPKDYAFCSSEVSELWKLLDLPDSDQNGYNWESPYLEELVQRSILHLDPYDYDDDDDDDDLYIMHDLIHDLACFSAGEEFCRIDGDTLTEIPHNVRYLSITNPITSADISAFPHSLRAIRVGILQSSSDDDQAILPESLLSNCKKLRAIDVGDSICFSMALRGGVGHLKLLRYLYLDTSLYPSCIPANHVQNLVPTGIGHLTRLHTLPEIKISRRRCSLNIRDLRNINKIRNLSISGLGNVRHAEHAIEAQLQSKKDLRYLLLNFDEKNDDECPCGMHPESVRIPHEQLLDRLRPHHNLRELRISGYNSEKYPSWLGNTSFFMMTRIELCDGGSKNLPELGALPSLKYLAVIRMCCVERIHLESFRQLTREKEFPSLRQLQFEGMSEWSEWSGADAGGFPFLSTLSLLYIPKLNSLPLGLFKSLETLKLVECDSLATLPASPVLRILEIIGCNALREIPTLPSLLKLKIETCPSLSHLPTLPSLLKLRIYICPSLVSVGSVASDQLLTVLPLHLGTSPAISAVCSLPKLTTLELDYCWNLCAVGNVPSLTTLNLWRRWKDESMGSPLYDFRSLQCLNIGYTASTCLPIKQQSLPSLVRLRIIRCPNLQYCDGLRSLTSLEHLEVRRCPKLPIYNLHPPQLKTLIIQD